MNGAAIEQLAAEYIAEDWTPDRYYRELNLIAFAEKLLSHGYAEGRKDEAEEHSADCAAGKLIDEWAAAKGKPVPWATAVEIICIVQKLSEAERARLLALWDEA